jgi:outer membrane receptor protein involved in Fe transport
VFEMRNKDEIHYGVDPVSGLSVNRNYERATRRTGAELEARWQATPRLGLSANLGYVLPRFEGSDADIPLVPRVTASVQAQWKVDTRSQWSIALRHVGKRYDGNDVSNRLWPQVPAYTVVDALWQLDLGQAELSLGINNLFNRAYSTLGYSASYYPMPERAVHARLRVSW